MRDSFVDFLNHGVLPFVGREALQERIVRFWRPEEGERSELRVLLLVGEAGAGKSRLIDETIPLVERGDGVVVHLKLRPEGATSLAPLIVMGMARSRSARVLVPNDLAESLPACIGALRHLCALRRLLLVVEDAHLLSGSALREFSLLVESLADEPIALLLAARPYELAAHAIVSSYLVDELPLEPFAEPQIVELWRELFDEAPPSNVVDTLCDATRGNLLAIRSALRGSIRAGSIARQGLDGQWRVEINLGALQETARRGAGGVVGGMLADLSQPELDAARALALLGELFSREGGELMLGEEKGLIESLVFKGILAHPTTSSTTINGRVDGALPIAFTHTLLHAALFDAAPTHVDKLVRVLAHDAPLYSMAPMSAVRRGGATSACPPEEIIGAVQAMIAIGRKLDMGVDWKRAPEALDAAEHLLDVSSDRLSADLLFEWRLKSDAIRIGVMRRSTFSPEYRELALRLLETTKDLEREDLMEWRLVALASAVYLSYHEHGALDASIALEAGHVVEKHPRLRSSSTHLHFLITLAYWAGQQEDRDALRSVERVVTGMIDSGEASDEFIAKARVALYPSFLSLYDSAEELEQRVRQCDEIERLVDYSNNAFYSRKIYLLRQTGRFAELDSLVRKMIPYLADYGMDALVHGQRNFGLLAEGMLGLPFDERLERTRALVAENTNDLSGRYGIAGYGARLGRNLLLVSLMRGEIEAAPAIIEEFIDDGEIDPHWRMLLALWKSEPIDALQVDDNLAHRHLEGAALDAALRWSRSSGDEPLPEEAMRLLEEQVFHFYRVPSIYIVISLVERRGKEIDRRLRDAIGGALERVLEWLDERALWGCMTVPLDRYGKYIGARDAKRWRTRIDSLERAYERRRGGSGVRAMVTMLGAVTLREPGGEASPIRGERVRIALGTIVAAMLVRGRFDRERFFSLATGIEGDAERARVTWNVVAMRVREAIGKEMLVTSGEIPSLNEELVEVDLVDAWRSLDAANEKLREGRITEAREGCARALDLAAGKVPFPTLYDQTFEELREQMENKLRATTLAVAARLLDAGDRPGADALLRPLADAIGNEEEVEMMRGARSEE